MATRIKPAPPQEQQRGGAVRAAAFDPETMARERAPAWPHESGVQVGPGPAPGRPGDEPRWATADKQGVGTALSPTGKLMSRVWFTIARGILTEVFYPHVDHPSIRELGLVITDGRAFFSAEQSGCDHRVEYPVAGVPLYRVINTCRAGRYRVEKTIFAHPTQDAVLSISASSRGTRSRRAIALSWC